MFSPTFESHVSAIEFSAALRESDAYLEQLCTEKSIFFLHWLVSPSKGLTYNLMVEREG